MPCIVETAGGSPELQELRLIMANADTRKMSSVDLAKQAERVQELLYKLKEQGVEFPGRMRDHVAEACKVSKTKLAELKVIQDKLTNREIRWYWDNGKLNQAQAYALAQAEPYVQATLCTYVGDLRERLQKKRQSLPELRRHAGPRLPQYERICSVRVSLLRHLSGNNQVQDRL